MLIPTNTSHIASSSSTIASTIDTLIINRSLENRTENYNKTFLAAQDKFGSIDPCKVEAGKIQYKEFAYNDDTLKTIVFSHCKKIWLKIKSTTLNIIYPLEGEVKLDDINTTALIKARKEKIIDKIDTTLVENKQISVVYPILNTSIFHKNDLHIRLAQYPLNSNTTIPKPRDIYQHQDTIHCDNYFTKSEFSITDLNRIVYDNGNTFISYGMKHKGGEKIIEKHFMVTVNKKVPDKKWECSVFCDNEDTIHLCDSAHSIKDITQATIIPDCTQRITKSLVAIYLEKKQSGDSLKLCNSRVNEQGIVEPCYYGKKFYDQQFNKGALEGVCDGDGHFGEPTSFYLNHNQHIRTANLGKVGEHAVILYADQNNNLHSYIVNGKTKIIFTQKYDDKSQEYHLINNTQKLLHIEGANVTQVHVGQVPGVENQLYACCLDTNNTLYCLHGNITLTNPQKAVYYSDKRTIYNSTVITLQKADALAIYNVTAEVFSNNTIHSLYQSSSSLTTTAAKSTVPTTDKTTESTRETTAQPSSTVPTTKITTTETSTTHATSTSIPTIIPTYSPTTESIRETTTQTSSTVPTTKITTIETLTTHLASTSIPTIIPTYSPTTESIRETTTQTSSTVPTTKITTTETSTTHLASTSIPIVVPTHSSTTTEGIRDTTTQPSSTFTSTQEIDTSSPTKNQTTQTTQQRTLTTKEATRKKQSTKALFSTSIQPKVTRQKTETSTTTKHTTTEEITMQSDTISFTAKVITTNNPSTTDKTTHKTITMQYSTTNKTEATTTTTQGKLNITTQPNTTIGTLKSITTDATSFIKTVDTTTHPLTIPSNRTKDKTSYIQHSQPTEPYTTFQAFTENKTKNTKVAITAAFPSALTVLLSCIGYIFYKRRRNKTTITNSSDNSRNTNCRRSFCPSFIEALRTRRNSQVHLTGHTSLSHDNPAYSPQSEIANPSNEDVIFDMQHYRNINNTVSPNDNPSGYLDVPLYAVGPPKQTASTL